jgi:hypothetical protein
MAIQRTIEDIIPDAVKAVHNQIRNGDGKLALQLLERLNAVKAASPSNAGDTNLTIAINTLINGKQPEKVMSHVTSDVTRMSHVTESARVVPHPSSQEGVGVDLELNAPVQNFPLLTGHAEPTVPLKPDAPAK